MLVYPLQGKRLGWLLLMSGAAMLFQRVNGYSEAAAMALGALWWLVAFKLAGDALSAAAYERSEHQVERAFSLEGLALRQIGLGAILLVALWLLGFFAGELAQLAACVGLAIFLPAMVMVLVIKRSLLRALDPGAWFQLLRRVGSDYLVLAMKLAGLGAVIALALVLLVVRLPPWLATTVLHFLALYALLAGYHAMGKLLASHHAAPRARAEDSAFAACAPPSASALAMHECERLVAAGSVREGSELLERHLRAHDASAALHARYRELLTGLGDNEGLARYSLGCVATLLAQGQEREAMALYVASRAMYGEFGLEDEAQLRGFIAVAQRNRQDTLAATLAGELARRFPARAALAAHDADIIDVEWTPSPEGEG